ncbi:LOW QUALITY PROTEIN: relaxin-3 [Pseudorca crassidens]|uniref:LOW QUALITY PROTEIN: relaxin-3 n=1 Tax=Pseudorca crassidens TaxID=82174 RepID=UPI00352EF193
MYKWGARRRWRHQTGSCLAVPPLTSQAALSSMAKRPLLLLLAMGVLAGELWTEAQAAPYGVKLCGREFIRAVIFTCGGSWWRQSDILAYEAMAHIMPFLS